MVATLIVSEVNIGWLLRSNPQVVIKLMVLIVLHISRVYLTGGLNLGSLRGFPEFAGYTNCIFRVTVLLSWDQGYWAANSNSRTEGFSVGSSTLSRFLPYTP